MEKDGRNGPILTKVESTQIFGNIEEIYHLHLTIAEQLDRALNEDASIGSVFLTHVSFLKSYSETSALQMLDGAHRVLQICSG
jgi:hypothetical protein